MARNLDLTALRSLVAVADLGGVTRAAGFLNLTQSAVSMQLKRLEEALDVSLLDRSARTISTTNAGEQLIGYARKMLALNDEAFMRLTDQTFEGELVLGVPCDIVYPAIPQVLRRFRLDYPRMRVQLISSYTKTLKESFARGEADIILTTEDQVGPGGECLARLPLVWIGGPGGVAYRQRPLPLAFEQHCIFRQRAQSALTAAGIPWEAATESDQSRTIEALVSADLAVNAMLLTTTPPYAEPIDHRGDLPDLGDTGINVYTAPTITGTALCDLAALVRQAFTQRARPALVS